MVSPCAVGSIADTAMSCKALKLKRKATSMNSDHGHM